MQKTCEVCDGSGQVSFFKGESRFVISWEDCPQCLGTGFEVLPVASDEESNDGETEGNVKEER